MRHTSTSRKVFVVCNTIFLVTMALLCILPLWNLLAISFSGKSRRKQRSRYLLAHRFHTAGLCKNF
ncbi:MAG: hypothetical protein ACLTNN_01820 [Blautia sp.]